MHLPSGSEDEPELYQYSAEECDGKDKSAAENILRIRLEFLLKDSTLSEREPITYCSNPIEPSEQQASCEFVDGILCGLNKCYPLLKTVRPYITNGRSIILVGEAKFFPHLLYLPPICAMVEVFLIQ